MISRKMRIAVLTQEDGFVIPQNIKLLSDAEFLDLAAIVRIDAIGSLVNKRSLFIRGFGAGQVLKMAIVTAIYRGIDFVDFLFLYKLKRLKSLRSAAIACRSEFKVVKDPNEQSFITWLQDLDLDLVVSFSAPCVFNTELLRLPKHGCINLHCSLLPRYAGLLPSFWALFHGADTFGATVHEMDDKIDNGSILGQVQIPKPSDPSMFNVIKETKSAGGKLMVSVVRQLADGGIEALPSGVTEREYYTWPTVEQIREFCSRGGRLI